MTWLARDAACLSSLLAVAQWPRMRWLSLLLLGAPCCRSGQTLQMLLPCSECWIGSVRSCPALNTLGTQLVSLASPCCKTWRKQSSELWLTSRWEPDTTCIPALRCLGIFDQHDSLLLMQTLAAAAFQAAAMPLTSQLLYSSTSAIWSQTGAAHYAAANAFLDAVATKSQWAGLPATAVQYGPFAGAGMAAGHVDELAALGLKALQPRQLLESQIVAGSSSQLVYARIDAHRFARIYSAKGRWGLLDLVLQTSSTAPAASSPAYSSSATTLAGNAAVGDSRSSGVPAASAAAAVSLEQVVHAIKTAAADILGESLDGERYRGC